MDRSKLTRIDDALLRQFAEGRLDSELEVKLAVAIEKSPDLQARVAAISSDQFLEKVKRVAVASPGSRASDQPQRKPAGSRASKLPDGIPQELIESPDYQVLKELGRGGMGVVYAAKYLPMDRMEVLKVLNPQMVRKESARQRFINEMKAIGKLNHPFIATAYQRVVLPTQLVFSMEYVPGRDLHKFIQKYRPIPVPIACTLASQIATALGHAHSRKMVHRDIKPSNVMVFEEDGKRQIKILDFGLAKATSEQQAEGLTADGTMLGTPEYMAPEQALDAATADIRADIYSLGCTLYHLLAGKPPFTGTYQSVLMAHAQSTAPAINLDRPDVPVELAQIVAKMMAKEPSKRFQTPKAVVAALKPFIGYAKVTPSQQASEAKVDTRNHLASPSRDTSVETPASPDVAPKPAVSLEESLSRLKVQSRTRRKPSRAKNPIQAKSGKRKSSPRRKAPPRGLLIAGGLFAAMLVWASVVMLKTDKGTLVIENIPENAEVLIDGKQVDIVVDGTTMTAMAVISEGEHQVQVSVDGNVVQGESVKISSVDESRIVFRNIQTTETKKVSNAVASKRTSRISADMTPHDLLTSEDYEWSEPSYLGLFPYHARDLDRELGDFLLAHYHAVSKTKGAPPSLYLLKRNLGDSQWASVERLGISSAKWDWNPSLSRDGLHMAFQSNRAGGKDPQSDIWLSRRETLDSPWSKPEIIYQGSTSNRDEKPCFAENGLAVYFNSARFKGRGTTSLVVTRRPRLTARWSPPEELGPEFDVGLHNTAPVLSADDRVLIFAARGNQESGDRYALWMSTREAIGSPWSKPSRLDDKLSLDGQVLPRLISPDGQTLVMEYSPYGANDLAKVGTWVSHRVKRSK